MEKFSFELKKKVVEAHLRGEGDYSYLVKKYNIKNERQVLNWVLNYDVFGDEGVMCSRNNVYSFKYKLHVVECYLSFEVSYQELALSEGITNRVLIVQWVNAFRVADTDALRPKMKGRKKTLNLENSKKCDTTVTDIEKLKLVLNM